MTNTKIKFGTLFSNAGAETEGIFTENIKPCQVGRGHPFKKRMSFPEPYDICPVNDVIEKTRPVSFTGYPDDRSELVDYRSSLQDRVDEGNPGGPRFLEVFRGGSRHPGSAGTAVTKNIELGKDQMSVREVSSDDLKCNSSEEDVGAETVDCGDPGGPRFLSTFCGGSSHPGNAEMGVTENFELLKDQMSVRELSSDDHICNSSEEDLDGGDPEGPRFLNAFRGGSSHPGRAEMGVKENIKLLKDQISVREVLKDQMSVGELLKDQMSVRELPSEDPICNSSEEGLGAETIDDGDPDGPRFLNTFRGGSSHSGSAEMDVTENAELMEEAVREMSSDDPNEDVPGCNETPSGAPSCEETIEAIPATKIQELSVQKRDRYRCPQCGKRFNRSGALSTHVKTHSSVRLFHCAECGKAFKRSDHLSQHFRSHDNTNPLDCPQCGKSFKHSGAVVSHMRSHIAVGHFACVECGRDFKLHRYLHLHMQAHTQEPLSSVSASAGASHERFHCEECGKGFKNPGALRMHATVHTSSRPYHCALCHKTFKDAPHLEQHMQVHTKCESLVCVECGKAFKNPRILATHLKIHSDDRPFECAGCGKTFKRSDHLSQHMRVHAEERRHVCAECGGAFDVPELLFKHVVSSHGEGEPATATLRTFQCGDCGQSFPLKAALVRHRRVHARQEQLDCSECGKHFKHLGALNTHMKFHAKSRPFQCTECKKSFIIPNHLARHMQAHYTRHLNRHGAEVNEEDGDSEASTRRILC